MVIDSSLIEMIAVHVLAPQGTRTFQDDLRSLRYVPAIILIFLGFLRHSLITFKWTISTET